MTDDNHWIRHLGDGLLMRRATVGDAERLADFHATVQMAPGQTPPNQSIHAWMADLLNGSHPTFQPSDFLLVEDEATGEIASSLCLISQEWTYDGVPLKVGQPEIVSTREEYRRRGLVRAQFDVIHQWSEERGELMQAITGIPWYYRQFGYEMALPLGGNRLGYTAHVPKLPPDVPEPFNIRPASEEDVPFIMEMYAAEARRNLVAAVRDEQFWWYELTGRSEKSLLRNELGIIARRSGEAIGFLSHKPELWGPGLVANLYELRPGVSWAEVTPTVIRYLERTGGEYAARDGGEWSAFSFNLGTAHPVYEAISERLPRQRKPYAWYVRMPDLKAFIRHIAPALEARLPGTAVEGHTGEITLSFYRGGLRLAFESGRITAVDEWRNTLVEDGNASFPEQTFLQLLFGRMTLDELESAFADCIVRTDEARAMLGALFPRRVSNVWPVA